MQNDQMTKAIHSMKNKELIALVQSLRTENIGLREEVRIYKSDVNVLLDALNALEDAQKKMIRARQLATRKDSDQDE